MDFFAHQDRARRNSAWLVGYFIVAVVMIVLAVYAATIAIVAFAQSREDSGFHLIWWHPELFIVVTSSVLLIITTGSLYKIWMIGGSGEHVAVALGGRKIPANTTDLAERILLNVVEEMALASGTPVPPVYLLDDEQGINAFAAGTSPQNAVIGVTRGAIDTFRREELQGVIAHEFSHILNGDMRLNLRLIGLLHGILVIALIGYMLLRLIGNSSHRRSSSSKKGEGGLLAALFAAGAALLVIGYVGVFFANLIKSAVSRQREFLADASAVQFTRNPTGIGNALKKIGGWKQNSQIKTPRAEEASHMFFGSAGLSRLFATHPSLKERVTRIDPQFKGPFSETRVVEHTTDELIDPRSSALAMTAPNRVHEAAVDGAASLGEHPEQTIQQVGEPRIEHVEYAHNIVESLDQRLSDDLRDSLGAVAVIYGLLLARADSPDRAGQIELLDQLPDYRPTQELRRILPAIDKLLPEQRLPVACMALPALHQMSPAQIKTFHSVAMKLIGFDRRISLFEFAVHRFIRTRLLKRLEPKATSHKENGSLATLSQPFVVALSASAYSAGPATNPERSFANGLKALGGKLPLKLLERADCNFSALDQSLDQLANAAPKLKRQMLLAMSECVATDSQVTVEEAELLRVFSDALGCPLPPLIER